MNEKEIQELLQNADEALTEQIASHTPAVDDRTKKRMLHAIQRRRRVRRPHPTRWVTFAGMAAALLLVVGMGAHLSSQLRASRTQPEPPDVIPAMTEPATQTQTEPAATEAFPTEPAPCVLTKEWIFDRCMTTVSRLHRVTANVEIAYLKVFSQRTAGELVMDFDNSRYFGLVTSFDLESGQVVQTDERFVYPDHSVRFWQNEEWDYFLNDGTPAHQVWHRQGAYVNGPGELDRSNYTYDPTGLFHDFAEFYMPQDTTRGFLSNLSTWEITGREDYFGRDCAVIEGTSLDYGRRYSITHFTIRVDIETGAWLFFEGYDDAGACNCYLHTSDVVFDDPAMQVPEITEAEVDGHIADGYVLNEIDVKFRNAYLAGLADEAETVPTEQTNSYAGSYILPETMPEPFAPGTEVEELFYRPTEIRFEAIPPELQALVPDVDLAKWQAGYPELSETAVTSVGEYANKYTFIRDFGLSEEKVRAAMQPYIAAWDYDVSLRQDELDAIVSGNQSAMLYDFVNIECIIVGDRFYTPKWVYEHSIEDYQAAGITPEMMQAKRPWYQHYDFTPEAQQAFTAKLDLYTAS